MGLNHIIVAIELLLCHCVVLKEVWIVLELLLELYNISQSDPSIA